MARKGGLERTPRMKDGVQRQHTHRRVHMHPTPGKAEDSLRGHEETGRKRGGMWLESGSLPPTVLEHS